MRPKTKRRLLILLTVLAVVTGTAVTLVQVTSARKARLATEARAAGMEAFARGDYETALKQLSAYNAYLEEKNDAEAIYHQAVARSMVAEPNQKHLKTAADWLERYRYLRPDDINGKLKLLSLYRELGRASDVLMTADDILKLDPRNLPALYAKADTYFGQRKFKEALAVSEEYNRIAPLDLEGQSLTYAIYEKLKVPGDQVVARAKADLEKYPEDPRMELLLAIAYGYAGDDYNARRTLATAASRKAPDAAFVRYATRLLDADKAFDVSRAMLERASADLKSRDVLRLLVQRLWQDGRIAEMGEKLDAIDANDRDADTSLLAMKAISLYDRGDNAAAKMVVDALARRTTDDEAYAWSTAITAYYGGRADPKEAITSLQSAANRDKDNPVIYLWMGDAYEQLGEVELACDTWKTAARLSPAWAAPHVRTARLLAANGRATEAYQAAQQATSRSPKALDVRIAAVFALSAKLVEDNRSLNGSSLLRLVSEIQHDVPNEPQTLPMYVSLLARSGQTDKAVAVLKDAIAPEAKLSLETLLKLADVSTELKLGLDDQVLAAASRLGPSPTLALAQARRQHAAGKVEDAIAALRQAADNPPSDPAEWQLALAVFLDEVRQQPDVAGWKLLVEKYPADLRVQSAFLKSPARHYDRDLWAGTLERFKAITREEGVRYRLERARFLLSGDPTDRERADALTIANELLRINPDLAEARMMHAAVSIKTGNRATAIEQLKKVLDLQPQNLQAGLTLARLLQEHGQTLEAQSYLSRFALSSQLTPADKRVVAQLFADLGQTAKAISVLVTLPDPDLNTQVTLAQLYRRDNRTREAAELFEQIVDAKPITAEAIAAAADFYLEQKNPAKADAVFSRLEELKDTIPPAQPHIIRGQLAERHQSPDAAREHFEKAAQVANDAASHRELAGFYIRRGELDQARTVALAGLSLKRDDAELAAMLKGIDALAAIAPDQRLSLAAVVSRNPTDHAVTEVLAALSKHKDPSKRLSAVKAAADRHPQSWPALEQLALAYQATGQMSRARETASRALGAAPHEPGPARLQYALSAAAGDWHAAKAAADQWRQRSLPDPRPADVASANASLELKQNEHAIAVLTPYLGDARKDLTAALDVLWPYARALLREGRTEEASTLMLDAAKTHESVRALWLAMAGEVRPSAAAATAWINQIAPQVGDSAKERQMLGWAWFSIGQRYDDTAAFARAAEVYRGIIDRGDGSLANLIMLADALRGAHDYPAAEAAYRQAITAGDGGHSCNALAFLLLLQDKQLEEALSFANRAVHHSPRNATFYDTRGQIHLKLNQPKAAVEDFDKALSLNHNSVEALVGKAAGLNRMGQSERAKAVLKQAESAIAARPLVSRYTRTQLADVRKALGD